MSRTAVVQLRQHLQPELGALVGCRPQPQHLFVPIHADADGHMHGADLPPPLGPHLHHQRVEIDDRIDRVERARLPRLDLLEHRLGHVGDQRWRHLHLVHFFQVALNLAGRHAARIQGQNLVVEPMPARLPLRHQLRLEARFPVPRHRDLKRAKVALQTLAARPVSAVPPVL